MAKMLVFTVLGYLSGSILFAKLYGAAFGKDITGGSKDGNPGAANAFMQGGMLCGILTLAGDLAKGFIPVFLYLRSEPEYVGAGLALVMAAPVAGHDFSVFYRFRGGKGIAVSFGCLAGLFPDILPVLILAATYLTLSLLVRISPHYYRTLAAYGLTSAAAIVLVPQNGIKLGTAMISAFVVIKHLLSAESKEKINVSIPLSRK